MTAWATLDRPDGRAALPPAAARTATFASANDSGGVGAAAPSQFAAPAISLPKGGGAVRGIGEKFGTNPVTGTGALSVPVPASPGRSGFGPVLTLSYDSGNGNGPYGFGWNLALPSITRKTDKGVPTYLDDEESDVFVLSGAEDLVPVLRDDGKRDSRPRTVGSVTYRVDRYRPRTEGLFARIERWTDTGNGAVYWRSISRDNVTTLYGTDDSCRISDGADPAAGHRPRVFSWLICESYDDKGNAVVYTYKAENETLVDLDHAHERGRPQAARLANRYVTSIRYGNRVSRLKKTDFAAAGWMFELVFDYGQYHTADPKPGLPGKWTCRDDPFSTYRSGFEVRTYRLCQRILMFHHFPDEDGVGDDCLVRSLDLTYKSSSVASFITEITQTGYRRAATTGYVPQALPPLELGYSEPVIDDNVRFVDPDSLENLPAGVDGTAYQWIDLDGEGVPGVLSEQAGAWCYKPNLGGGRLGPLQLVASVPTLVGAGGGQHQFLDLAGDGQLDLVEYAGPTPGFAERTSNGDWAPLTSFRSLPNADWADPNLRFVDLTGDGHADILRTEDDALVWYPSLAEDGFGPAERAAQPVDDDAGPRLVFADGTQSVYLADMSGDGLTDLVRIRNGEVCYWPSLGYGRFGAKVSMDDAPRFDRPDQFDQQRIRIADIDGSGNTDLIYLGAAGVYVYVNQSGNRWSGPRRLDQAPPTDNLSTVAVADLLGNGTACLVWSSPLPADASRPMRYLDLMGGQKPHLLTSVRNNLGAETHIRYAPSTRFYLADKAAGRPWATRLPFPVHVVERVETYDRISRNRFVSRYSYHHGHFDGVEREFRGFGLVKQYDTEEFDALSAGAALPAAGNVDAASHLPPVLTKTWFHTGAYLEGHSIAEHFAGEYYREPGLTDEQFRAHLLDDTLLPAGLSVAEEREACRALRGSVLRQEVYALDGSTRQQHPYSVTESSHTVVTVQPMAGNRHAVFFTHPVETISYHYERDPADPRVGHELTLQVDPFGNVLRSAAVGYGRRVSDPGLAKRDRDEQAKTHITYTENGVTNDVGAQPLLVPDTYRAPLPYETRVYEVTGLTLHPGQSRFAPEDFTPVGTSAMIGYEDSPSGAVLQRRLIEHTRIRYRSDDLDGPLALGVLESLALPYDRGRLAFTPTLVTAVYGTWLTDLMLSRDGGYTHSDGDTNWWTASGQVFYSPGENDSPADEFDAAREHFFLPRRFTDPFAKTTTITYDDHDLLPLDAKDPLGNHVTAGERDTDDTVVQAGNDYRVLKPRVVMDPNRNRTAVAFDILGLVVGTAVQGKPAPETAEGDTLDGFEPDLPEADALAYLRDPLTSAGSLLGGATTRIVYDLFAYRRSQDDAAPAPPTVAVLARETHDPLTKIQHSFSYSDGFGREIQRKGQAEKGRWVGTGWTIYNNKGKPVRQYEPFFAATHRFELAKVVGVSPVLCYDPVGRVVATLHPNHTYDKVVFDAWRQETWDVNDTVLAGNPAQDADVGASFGALPPDDYLPTWYARRAGGALGADERAAADKAAVHAGTPSLTHLDSLGRVFLTVAHNRFIDVGGTTVDEHHETRVELDIEANQRAIVDARGRTVARYDYDIAGNRIHQASMEAGARWTLGDATGKPIYGWDSLDHRFHTRYDDLRRPIEVLVSTAGGSERLAQRTSYGESAEDPAAINARGKVVEVCDDAGKVESEEYDFKGNLLSVTRTLAVTYKGDLDWSKPVPLEAGGYTSRTEYDALNRPTTLSTPDTSRIALTYNETGLLQAIEARLRSAATATRFIDNIDYDAKGQRTLIEYSNGVNTTYDYDPDTFRLTRLHTSGALQDLSYVYDPAGNITHIQDDAQQTVFFNNHRVTPSADYTYDAVYRLIEATGREQLGQAAGGEILPTLPGPHPGDGTAMGRYIEQYIYDKVGNIDKVIHAGTDPVVPGWTRSYLYTEPSLVQAGATNNRLTATRIGSSGPWLTYGHDAHGNMTSMPHLPRMAWNEKDQLRATAQQVIVGGVPETTFYIYDGSVQRVRKVTERQLTAAQVAADESPTRKSERIYLGGVELYREYNGDGTTVALERETLHVMDDKQRVALVETKTRENGAAIAKPEAAVRFQLGNHLGSAVLELDDAGAIISYEEYHPYGTTSYVAGRTAAEVSLKRYRYTGMERDNESGLAYHRTRYYAPWLARWASPDSAGMVDGPNLYRVVRDSPIGHTDPTGAVAEPEAREEMQKLQELPVGAIIALPASGATSVPPSAPEYAYKFVEHPAQRIELLKTGRISPKPETDAGAARSAPQKTLGHASKQALDEFGSDRVSFTTNARGAVQRALDRGGSRADVVKINVHELRAAGFNLKTTRDLLTDVDAAKMENMSAGRLANNSAVRNAERFYSNLEEVQMVGKVPAGWTKPLGPLEARLPRMPSGIRALGSDLSAAGKFGLGIGGLVLAAQQDTPAADPGSAAIFDPHWGDAAGGDAMYFFELLMGRDPVKPPNLRIEATGGPNLLTDLLLPVLKKASDWMISGAY